MSCAVRGPMRMLDASILGEVVAKGLDCELDVLLE